ncbi:type 4a pilus biogenesis protein PilO [Candidatus Woesebacteria bacterium]|nr:type 4a pilus biogenesis protein PilO [Candidatus Woesebacteria bacterium]
MPEKKLINTSQISSTLASFYSKPVARVSLELFLSLGLVLILVVVAIQPTLTTIAKLNTEIEEKTGLSSQLTSKIASLTTAINLYTQYQSKIPLLDEALPPTAQLIPTLKIIEKVAQENNVVLTGVGVANVPEESDTSVRNKNQPLAPLPISVGVMGQYQDMRKFVEALHQSRRTIRVLSANFTLDETRGQRALSASFIVDAPYYGTSK